MVNSKPHIYTKLKNSNGSDIFGYLPEMKVDFKSRKSIIIPPGNIHLFYGNQVFGFDHIWRKHGKSFKDEFKIPTFIESILISGTGTQVFCEDFSKIKPIVLKQNVGQVVLQYRQDNKGDYHYSIVTAYPISFSKNKGKKIGDF